MTTIHCDEEECRAESPVNLASQWATVTVAVHEETMTLHFCPTCWSKILIRKALAINDKEKQDDAAA